MALNEILPFQTVYGGDGQYMYLQGGVYYAADKTTVSSADALRTTSKEVVYGVTDPLTGGIGLFAGTNELGTGITISVKDAPFLAVGDGIHDDTAAIQSAITYLGTVHGGTLLFPNGVYAISSALTIASDAVTLKGVGSAAPAHSLTGCSVIRTSASCNAIAISASIGQLTLENISFASSIATLSALYLSPTGGISNLLMRNVFEYGMLSAITVDNGATLTHAHIEFCQFGYSLGNHVNFINGAVINSVLFLSTRFEEGSTNSHFKAVGSITGTGSCKFINCVFEACRAQRAVDVGNNANAFAFIGCHFEGNSSDQGGTPTDGGCDIYLGGGLTNVLVDSCQFSIPNATATNFYNIRNELSSRLTTLNNIVHGIGHAGYLGFVLDAYGISTTLIGNIYTETGSPWLDYANGVNSASRINDYQSSLKAGSVVGPITKSLQTTNATPTSIWGGQYQFQPSSSVYANAEVVGTDSTGAVYCAFNIRQLFSADASNNITSRGTMSETPIASGAQAAAFAISGTGHDYAGLNLNVTGIAATTIKWVAKISFVKIGF